MEDELLTIDLPLRDDAIIKVMGVGGGGCNAVNYMYSKGIKDVSFLVCNTDKQALGRSSVPAKLQLGPGLGAGGRPERAKELAEESRDRIREALNDGTQMLFLAAGMGGGTGTGATSIVAEVAQEMEILTVGIVTIPFAFEGKPKIRKAMTGVATLAEHVDALLVINNEKLRQIYPDLNLLNAFSKSDDVVCDAAKSIAEIITVPGYINTDFADVYNTLKDGKVAIMNVGQAGGEKRIHRAINNALQSPLINANDVHGAKRILLQLYCSKEHAILTQEIDQVHEFVQEVGEDVEVQWGISIDESLAEDVRVTIIATGYEVSDIPSLDEGSGNPSVDEAIVTNYPEEKAPAEEEKPQETKQEEEIEVTVTETQPAQEEPKPAVPQANEAPTDSQPVEIDLTDTIQQSQPVRRGFAAWMRGRR
ncbi:MAG: cell division protein FtsZ [Paludibacteraceae bacterium]|nr:cell division protein FtsZ [Paludibacteraceae bacterium]